MRIKCIHNLSSDLPEALQDYAFTQDQHGTLDISVGQEYQVFGIRNSSDLGKLYLTSTNSRSLPWWMPESLYEVVDDTMPSTWTEVIETHEGIKSNVVAPPIYHGHEEDIADSTPEGHKIFQQMQIES